MIINDVQFNDSLEDVFTELQKQLELNGFTYFQKGFRDSGNDIMVQCPYHGEGQERKPSAGIRKSDGQFHCFACNETHSLPEVISYCFGYDDMLGKEGWKWLLKNFATISREERKDVELDFYRKPDSRHTDNYDSIIDTDYVSEKELDSYRYYHPYWEKRGITDEDIIELFDLGYDPKTKCITFPVRDIYGRCLFVARRNVHTKFFNYPQGIKKPLYGLYELNKKYPPFLADVYGEKPVSHPMEVIICESMLDALSFWQVGKDAVALNGLGNELQFKQLRELNCRKLILATDNDERGMLARKRIMENVKNKLFTQYLFPEGRKDANECTPEELLNLEEVF